MSYLGYVVNVLLNEDLRAQNRGVSRGARRRRQRAATVAPQPTVRPPGSAKSVRAPEIVRPAPAAKLGA